MLDNELIGQTGTKHNFQPLMPTYGALDGCCLMIRKSLLDDIGHFDETIPGMVLLIFLPKKHGSRESNIIMLMTTKWLLIMEENPEWKQICS